MEQRDDSSEAHFVEYLESFIVTDGELEMLCSFSAEEQKPLLASIVSEIVTLGKFPSVRSAIQRIYDRLIHDLVTRDDVEGIQGVLAYRSKYGMNSRNVVTAFLKAMMKNGKEDLVESVTASKEKPDQWILLHFCNEWGLYQDWVPVLLNHSLIDGLTVLYYVCYAKQNDPIEESYAIFDMVSDLVTDEVENSGIFTTFISSLLPAWAENDQNYICATLEYVLETKKYDITSVGEGMPWIHSSLHLAVCSFNERIIRLMVEHLPPFARSLVHNEQTPLDYYRSRTRLYGEQVNDKIVEMLTPWEGVKSAVDS